MTKLCPAPTEQALCLDAPFNTTTAKWQLLPGKDQNVLYEARYGVEITPLINGQAAFTALEQAILNAKDSIDIICWGFDPSLRLSGPDGKYRFGELLEKKARERVEVRVMIWYSDAADWFTGFKEESLPDIDLTHGPYDNYFGSENRKKAFKESGDRVIRAENIKLKRAYDTYLAAARAWASDKTDSNRQTMSQAGQHFESLYNQAYTLGDGTPLLQWQDKIFNEAWYRKVVGDQIKGLYFTTRDVTDTDAVIKMEDGSEAPFGSFMQEKLGVYGVTHHQKMVLIDYMHPDKAVGFVMGHNMQKNYFDNDKHEFFTENRYTGFRPWQDISTRVRGPVLVDLNHNFSTSWDKEIADSSSVVQASKILSTRARMTKEHFSDWSGSAPIDSRQRFKCDMAQVIRTEYSDMDKSILRSYENALNNVTDYIYSENQYFRYKPFADQLIELAAKRKAKGAKDLHWFVVTNKPNSDGEGANTYTMLKALGQADRLPQLKLNELKHIKELERSIAGYKLGQFGVAPSSALYQSYERSIKRDQAILDQLKERHPETARLREEERAKEVKDELDVDDPQQAFELQNNVGLKVHVATLATCTRNPPPGYPTLYTSIYVHSKLLLVDDVYFLLGSSNINKRSMELDTELAIATPTPALAKHTRQHLWRMHSEKVKGSSKKNYQYWDELMRKNWKKRYRGEALDGFLVHFYDPDCEAATPND